MKIRRLGVIAAVGSVFACATAENGAGVLVDGGADSSFGGFGGTDAGTGATGNGGLVNGGSGGVAGSTGGIAGAIAGGTAGVAGDGTGGVLGGGTGGLGGGTGGVLGGGTGGVVGGGTGGVLGGGTGGLGGAPVGWNCNPLFYGDTDCDCGCGVVDVDCLSAAVGACDWCDLVGSCSSAGCPGTINPTNNAVCGGSGGAGGTGGSGGVPTTWTCNPAYYGDIGCDCGCGAVDIDCVDATVASCDYCDELGSCNAADCPGTINPIDNATCVPIPTGWNCDPSYYGDGDCDCGCGVKDIDCPTSSVSDCEFCSLTGSCSATSCPGDIKPTDNAVCN